MDNKSILRATPAARAYAKKHNIDLAEVRGTGIKGRVHKEDVVVYKLHTQVKISPLAKRIAEFEGLNLNVIKGSGANGKIMKSDVLALLNGVDPLEEASRPSTIFQKSQQVETKAETKTETKAAANTVNNSKPATPAPQITAAGEIEIIPMSPMRKVIAKRMSESYFSAPTFIVNVDVDMTNLLNLRKQVLNDILEATGKKATVTDFVSMAVVKALLKHPYVNASLTADGKEIHLHHFVNLAIAVGSDSGLLVPVVNRVDQMSLKELVVACKEMTSKAINGKLTPQEMQGSTFTISNLGMYGVDSFIPIINQPNSAILGISATKKKPVVIDDQIVIRPIMTLTLTADHRVIDGLEGAKFMQTLKAGIENPLSLLI